ncbi:hypothetical protein FGB62_16g246 [Gracilaria domingensis]|nr:hypothetical protein FGB62_16g246 [Gracilaria domingensis]
MDRRNEPKQKKKHTPSSSSQASSSSFRLRRSSSSANLRKPSPSHAPTNVEAQGASSSAAPIPQAARVSNPQSSQFSRGRDSERSQPNIRLSRNPRVSRNFASETPPGPSSSQAHWQPVTPSSPQLDLLDSISSPVLSLRRGSNNGAGAAASQAQQIQHRSSQSRLGNVLRRGSANVEQAQRSRNAGATTSFTCPTCRTPLPDRDSYKKQYVNSY